MYTRSFARETNERMSLLMLDVILLVVVSVSGVTRPSCQYNKDRQFLDCSSRGFLEVPTDEFPVDVRGIDLSFNKISVLTNRTFWNTSFLEYLDLSNNGIQAFQPDAFQGLRYLVCLNLSNNEVKFCSNVFTPPLFQPLLNLKIIRIQGLLYPKSCTWEGIDAAFAQLKSLTTLFLDIVSRFYFGPGFAEMTKLVTISTEQLGERKHSCIVGSLEDDTFQVFKNISVRELRLIGCQIFGMGLHVFDPLTSLDVLELSYNNYLKLADALKALRSFEGRNMSTINLKMLIGSVPNRLPLSVVSTSDFAFLRTICVKSVDLSLNHIFLNVGANDTLFRFDCLEYLNISFHCDPFIPIKLACILMSQSLKTLDISRGYSLSKSQPCFINPFQQTLIPKLSSNDKDQYQSLALPNLRHIGVAYMDDDFVSPWYIFSYLSLLQLNYLDMSGADCTRLDSDFFGYVQNVTSLRLAEASHIEEALVDSPHHFSYLRLLQLIDLSSNKLTYINPKIFQHNPKLHIVNLANNKLHRIPPAVSELPELQRLDMRSNAITHLDVEDIRLLDRWINNKPSFKILLGENILQCTCDTVLFIRWILERKANLDNPDNYTCFLANGTRIRVSKFGEQLRDFEVKCVSHTYLIIAFVGSLALIMLILMFAAIYRYRLNLRYWLYTKLYPPEDLFEDKEYVYDAFVAYTSDDRDWVVNELIPRVEPNEGPTRLCIHDRDFTFGKPIHINIVEKMAESRKIMLIISPGYLESTYGPLEIEYAGMKCLDQGRDDIILCVLMEDIPVRQMPRVLRNLWHKITFLKWSADPQRQVIFWRNLKSSVCLDQA